jgi:hypothetical protein
MTTYINEVNFIRPIKDLSIKMLIYLFPAATHIANFNLDTLNIIADSTRSCGINKSA